MLFEPNTLAASDLDCVSYSLAQFLSCLGLLKLTLLSQGDSQPGYQYVARGCSAQMCR